MSLINIASPEGAESALADSVEAALRALAHLDVERIDDTVVARTDAGHAERVMVAAHLGTAPVDEDPLAYVEMGRLFGPGAADAKGALAMSLRAAALGGYTRDVTFLFHTGVSPTVAHAASDDELRRADFALIAEPTGSVVVGDQLDHAEAKRLIALTDGEPSSDAGGVHGLARFASLGLPAVAFGPGDPSVAGTPGEFVPTAQLSQCEFALRQWLIG